MYSRAYDEAARVDRRIPVFLSELDAVAVLLGLARRQKRFFYDLDFQDFRIRLTLDPRREENRSGSKRFEEQPASETAADPKPRTAAEVRVAGSRGRSGCFGRRAPPAPNRIKRSDPEGATPPEGEAEIRGETGIEGLNSGQRAAALRSPTPGQTGASEESRAERT